MSDVWTTLSEEQLFPEAHEETRSYCNTTDNEAEVKSFPVDKETYRKDKVY